MILMLLKSLFLALFIMSVTVLSVLQIILVVVLVILVLLQPPGSSSLSGFSNSQQGMNSIIPIKSSENPLSRITSIVAGLFIINTLLLSGLCSKDVHKNQLQRRLYQKRSKKANQLLFHLKINERNQVYLCYRWSCFITW